MRANARLLPLLLAIAAAPALATVPSVADLDAVQGETILLRAQAAKAKASQELDDFKKGGATVGVASSAGEPALPTARGLFGANGKRYVVFLYANGGVAEGKVGDAIPGGFRVQGFDSGGVDLRAPGGKAHRIPFSMQAPTPPVAAPTVQGPPTYVPVSVPPLTR